MSGEAWDVIVVGGGPAGSVMGGLLAQEGLQVLILEQDRHPRHHVGESLQPASLALLDQRFGLGPTLAGMGFARKYGALYVWGESREPWSVLFDPRLEQDLPSLTEERLLTGGYDHAWQVDRARFDQVLAQAAVTAGATLREGVEVEGPWVSEGGVCGVQTKDGPIAARFVVDASGQRRLFARAFGLVEDVPDMRALAAYAYFDGAGGLPGPLGRHAQLLVTLQDGWAWFIPISPTRTSVGVVVRERARVTEESFAALLREAGFPLDGATRTPDPLRYALDWSYGTKTSVGPGFLLVGDAACFVDPILSGGVDFAIRGAANGAIAVLRALEGEGEALKSYDLQLRKEYRAYLRLARYWYGNNRSVQGFFWEAHEELPPESVSTPLRAFVYLTSGRYAADQHFRVFDAWQEQKMFRALGVDRARLGAAVQARRR